VKRLLKTITAALLVSFPINAFSEEMSANDFGFLHGHYLIAHQIANSQILASACNISKEGMHVDIETKKVIKNIFEHVLENGELNQPISSFYTSPRYTWGGLMIYTTEFLKTGQKQQILLPQGDFKYKSKETELDLNFITEEFYKSAINIYSHRNCDDNLKAGIVIFNAALDFNEDNYGGAHLLISTDTTFNINWNVSEVLKKESSDFQNKNFDHYSSAYQRFLNGYEHPDYVHVYDRYRKGYLAFDTGNEPAEPQVSQQVTDVAQANPATPQTNSKDILKSFFTEFPRAYTAEEKHILFDALHARVDEVGRSILDAHKDKLILGSDDPNVCKKYGVVTNDQYTYAYVHAQEIKKNFAKEFDGKKLDDQTIQFFTAQILNVNPVEMKKCVW